MALKSPAFRRKFPLLVTGSLLAMQPFATSFVVAAEQYDCSVSASGAWDCAPKTAAAPLPPRPVHDGAAVSSANGTAQANAEGGTEAEPKTMLVTESKGRGLRSRSADYSHLDWVPREKLTAAQLAETGPYCSGAYIEPIRPGMNDKTNQSDAPTFIGAKASRYEQEQQVATLAGDVVMRQGSMQLESEEASLYQAENRGELNGNVRLRDNGALIVGDHAQVQLDTGAAQIDNAEYVMHKSRIRGNALYAKRAENAIIRLKDGTYTTCEPDSNAWQLKGNNITLNPATGFGTATNATLRIKNIPILYTPYIYFPIDNRRQSGFLPPSFSTGSETGFTLVTPYYFNLAPNYDATLYPQYMTKRGLLMEGEFRYLTKSSEGQFGGAYLNDDSNERSKQTDYEKTRYMLNWQHKGGLDSRLTTQVDYTKISDPYYFQDLKSYEEGVQSRDYLNQQGSVTYRGDSYQARVNVQAYQLATISQITPYDRLPQITFNGALPYHPGGLNFTYETEAVRFERSLENGTFTDENGLVSPRLDTYVTGLTRANGTRLNAAPAVDYPMNWTYGFITPKLKYVYTKYDLDLDGTGKTQMAAAGQTFKSSQDRAVPIASVDSGLYFDRNTNWFGKDYRQTLEPRAFYLYVPNKDQSDIPVFDTSEYSFSYASLFRDNRFSGTDRIGDENKLSLGLTSRWIEENGFERTHQRRPGPVLQGPRSSTARHRGSRPRRLPERRFADRAGLRVPLQPRLARHCRLQLGHGKPRPTFRQRDVPLPAGRQPEQDRQPRLSLSQRPSGLQPADRQMAVWWRLRHGRPTKLREGLLQNPTTRLLDDVADRSPVEHDYPLAVRLRPQPYPGSLRWFRVRQLLLETARHQPLLGFQRRIQPDRPA